MCDREGQNFGWFIEVLRICLSAMDELLELFNSPKFWVHFSQVVVGELIMMTYHLYTSFAHMHVFWCFFHTQEFPYKVNSHFMAPDIEIGMRYWGFGIEYSTPQFDGHMVLPAFLMDIEDSEESSDEEE